jgi:two-component system response regulator YesN
MYKVIIADDNALSIKGLEANLDFASIGAELAGSFLSGMDVLNYLEGHPDVDLLVSDIRMPHMTGLELAREALTRNKMMKIVLISAYDDFEYAQEALRIGVTDYVQKPIQYDELTETMRRALQKLEEERTVLKRLEAAQPELRKKFYLDLMRVHPMLAPQALAQEAQYLGIAAEGGSFLCVAVSGEKNEENIPASGTEAMILNQFLQTDALEAWFGAEMECHLISDREDQLILLHDPDLDEKAMVQKVRSLCERFGAAHEQLKATLYFGIGAAQDSLWKIVQSVDMARRAANRHFVTPDQQVFTESDEDAGMLPFLARITEAQGEIVQLLLRRDTAALDRMVAQLTESVVVKLKDQSLIVPYLVVMVSGVLGQISQDGVDLTEAERTVAAFGARGRHAASARDIGDMLRQFFRQTVDALDRSLMSYQQKLLGKVKQYIDAHLRDSQLRLENIADEVHVTHSHLSRIFKRSEGINVSDYITQKRIEKATQLLRSTSESISFVSEQVGYASPYYFSACFKKVTGMTPSEYRKGDQTS